MPDSIRLSWPDSIKVSCRQIKSVSQFHEVIQGHSGQSHQYQYWATAQLSVGQSHHTSVPNYWSHLKIYTHTSLLLRWRLASTSLLLLLLGGVNATGASTQIPLLGHSQGRWRLAANRFLVAGSQSILHRVLGPQRHLNAPKSPGNHPLVIRMRL